MQNAMQIEIVTYFSGGNLKHPCFETNSIIMNRMFSLLTVALCSICHPTLTAQAFVPIRRDDQTFPRNSALTPTSTPRVLVQPSNNPIFLQASSSPIKEDEAEMSAINPVELAGLAVWIGAMTTFLLRNNFVGPWPAIISTVPEDVWLFIHALAGMFFGGGIILTTCVEWLVAKSKNPSVLTFWFEQVPGLDLSIVLPAISVAIVSGTGLASVRYGGLGEAPIHIKAALHLLVFFAIWWASTDVTTQGPAAKALQEWSTSTDASEEVPKIVNLRKISNVVSCALVLAMYFFMVLKPGYYP
jgi:uncharacterized membrane protein